MIFPKRLKKGDLIGVIAPASAPSIPNLQQGLTFLSGLGLRVRLGKYIDRTYGYLAGKDEERLADFHEMIADPEVKGIFFARGGYGTGRLAADIDYELVRQHPKVIWGYSDITYLHTAIRQKSDLVTFHGPMIESDMGKDAVMLETKQMFQQLFTPMTIFYSACIAPLDVLAPGKATGEIVGGNLSLLVSTLGTPFEIDVRGKILFLEDVDEAPYQVDGMLNQLALASKFSDAAGIMIGDFAQADPKRTPSLTLEEVLDHYLSRLDCPVLSGFQMGHCSPNIGFPFGVQARMDTERKVVMIAPGVV